jgi:hypothetical protein
MKHRFFKSILTAMAAVVVFAGCKPDEPEASRPTFLPVVAVVGEELEVIVAGDEYSDPGATASENGVTIDYTTDGAVDPNTAGVYTINYSATNSDGFSATATRTVIVLPEPFVEGSADISGKYVLAVNQRNATLNKIVDGAYLFSDAWGTGTTESGGPFPVPAYLFSTNGKDVFIPNYPTAFGYPITGNGTFLDNEMVITTVLIGANGGADLVRIRKWTKN